MKRPNLPTVSLNVLPPACGRHEPHGTTGYCPACAMARIDREQALHPEIRRDWPRHRPHGALRATAVVFLLVTSAIALCAVVLIMQGVLTWHR